MKFKKSQTPRHVAIIMDGNRRWAKKNKLAAVKGHHKTARETIQKMVKHSIEKKIKYLTIWAFSTENWNRSQSEVTALMNLFREALGKKMLQLHQAGVKLNTIGDITKFEADIQDKLNYWIDKTKYNQKIILTLALNYGGRDELLRAIYQFAKNFKLNQRRPRGDDFEKFLDTADLPEPDLIIRPGGEKRISGFMPWQSVYSEFYFTDVLAPDFDEFEYNKALREYSKRKRRFGK